MRNYRAAATLVEMLVTTAVSGVVGGIIYTVASEGVISFARNASLNRAYTDARSAIEQIDSTLASAGQAPTLVDSNGVTSTSSQAEGVRFYRYGAQPSYQIPSGKASDKSLTINFSRVQAVSSNLSPVSPGDLATIPLVGYQDTVTSVSTPTMNADGSGSVTLTFANAIYTKCVPAISQSTSFAFVAADASTKPATPAKYYSCLVFQQVAYIAVPKATGGAELRYYPHAMSTGSGSACGGLTTYNSTTAFSNPQNYSVIANIPGTVTDATLTPLKPFLDPDASYILKIILCAEAPDYNNRNFNASNTYCLMQSSMGSRCPILLR